MATQVQFRGGSSTEHNSFTGAAREVTVDTTKDTVIVHDGSTAGGHPLQKQYPALGTASAPTYTFTGDINTGIYSPGTDQVAISTNGTGRLFVDASGNIGIGTSSPTSALHVSANDPAIFIQDANSTGNSVNATLQFRDSSNTQLSYFGFASASDSHFSVFNTMAGGDLRFGTASTERMRIDSSGNVGIGTSSPAMPLDVHGADTNAAGLGDVKGQLRVFNDTTAFGSSPRAGIVFSTKYRTSPDIPLDGAAIYGGKENAGDANKDFFLAFATRGESPNEAVERMRIDSSGNVGIGTTSPAAKLQIESSAADGAKLRIAFDSTRYYDIFRGSTTNSGLLNFYGTQSGFTGYVFGGVDGERMRIDSSGNTTFAGSVISGQTPAAGANNGAMLTTDGTVQVSRGAGSNVWAGYVTGTSAATSLITSSGNATFAGSIAIPDAGYRSSRGVKLFNTGIVQAAGTNTSNVWMGFNISDGASGTATSYILADGSASFAGGQCSILENGTISNQVDHTNGQASVFSNRGYINGAVQGTIVYKTAGNLELRSGASDVKVNISGTTGSATFAGTVTANGTVLTSDQRFKENITPANPQLADIKALGAQLKNYDWNADAPSSNGTRQLGLIAQDVEAVCPGIVKTIARTKQGAELTPEVVVPAVYETRTVPAVLDDEGEVVKAETTEQVLVTEEQITPATYEELDDSYKGISHDALIMKLLGAVAELSAKVAALEGA